jgi:hypothetical protein
VLWDGETVHCKGIVNNIDMRTLLVSRDLMPYDIVAIEMIACYGLRVGAEVFDTCVWIGRFIECVEGTAPVKLVFRSQVKKHLGCANGKDKDVRAALIARYGEPGTAKNPGRLYGISSHLWAALAVAHYAFSNSKELA